MIGAIIGIEEGSNGSSFGDLLPVAAATGGLVAGLAILSMVAQSMFSMELQVLQTLTLLGSMFSNPFAGTELAARFLSAVMAFLYGAGDVVLSWGLWEVIDDLKEPSMR